MGYVYLADQKYLRDQSNDDSVQKPSTKKGSIKDKKDDQSWGDTMGTIMKVIGFIDKYRIYRMNKIKPVNTLNGWGHLIGHFFFGNSRKIKRRMRASITALYPKKSPEWIEKVVKANARYMGMLLTDILFRLPQTCDYKEGHRVSAFIYENFEILDHALEEGKGAIIPIVHLGEHFHSPGGVFLHPKKYKMSVVASIKNLPMYEFNNRPHFNNLFIYASTKFANISARLQSDLEKNHTLVMFHDYGTKSQLRVPFIYKKFPYLIHTPQSYISLHRKTGAPILPLISVPDKVFGHSKLRFINYKSIQEVSKKYWDAPKKEFHGQLATEINRIIYPYVRVYAHQWEELMRFSGLRCADKLEFPPNISIKTMVQIVREKMLSIIENSFEPNRVDDRLITQINQTFTQVISSLSKPEAILRAHKTFIDLTLMGAVTELRKLANITKTELQKNNETQAISHIAVFLHDLPN